MEVTAQLKHLRVSPRKARLVADLIRGKKATQALAFLKFVPKKSSVPIGKLLQSAIANAKHNHELDEKNLRIIRITVDEGPTLKRWRPRAMGRAYEIKKRTSHVRLVLKEDEKEAKRKTINNQSKRVAINDKR